MGSPVTCISEYTELKKAQKAMKAFSKGEIRYLLMTERAYYFNM